jgi:hypothetical protein
MGLRLATAFATACVCALPATAAAQSKLDEIFEFDMLGAQVAYLEHMIGPAKHIFTLPKAGMQIRTYPVDGCKVEATTQGTEVLRYSLVLTPTCNFDLGKLVQGHATTKDLTVGRFADRYDASYLHVRSDCIYSCGNAADPRVDFIYEGSHADGWVSVVLTVIIADVPALQAVEPWENLMRSKEGDNYVLETKFNCDHKYDSIAVRAFENVVVNKITVGFFRGDLTECPAEASTPSARPPVTPNRNTRDAPKRSPGRADR